MGKLVDELLAYLSKASEEQLVNDWNELKEFNKVGPEITSFIEYSQDLNQIFGPISEIMIPNEFENPEFTLDFFLKQHNIYSLYKI